MNANTVIRKNARLSLSPAGSEAVAVAVQGQLKLLECDPAVLGRVLDAVGDETAASQIVEHFAGEFPAEDVLNFLATLTESGLLTADEIKAQPALLQPLPPLCLIGSGRLAETLRQSLTGEVLLPFQLPAEDDEIFAAGTVFILCPEQATFRALLDFNAFFLKRRSPFILCYFDGHQLAAGPSVLPGLTSCFGCYTEHRRLRLARACGSTFPWQSLEELAAVWPLPDTPQQRAAAVWAAELIAREAERLRVDGENPELLGRQLLFAEPSAAGQSAVEFFPISSCPACHALALDRLHEGRPKMIPPAVSFHTDKPVRYTAGGRRSISNQETKKLLNESLARLGAKVSIRRHHDGPLDHMLYRFFACTETNYDPKRRMIVPQQNSRGKGFTEEQAYFSAAFELFERISARYHGGVGLIRAPYCEVRDLAMNVPDHIGTVYHQGEMDRFDESLPIDWVWGHSLHDGSPKLVPASMVFLSNTRFMGQFYDTASGGLAAGGTYEDAVLQALLELVEHDAWMIWQANRVQRPRIVLDDKLPGAVRKLLDRIAAHGLRLVIRDYTSDFGFPVFRAWMIDDSNYSFYASNGFGASLDPAIALERSVSEAYQARDPGADRRISNYRNPLARDLVFQYHSLFALNHFKTLEMNTDSGAAVNYSSFVNQSAQSVSDDIRTVVSRICAVLPKAEVIAVNLTKDGIGVPVVRVIASGGMQKNAEPILSASNRLFNMPVMMGCRTERLAYDDLFNGVYPH
uniref:TOMM precursor leader peptide-binding protein n=1 Tax=Candidatus Electronema sp. TaxID=2698783 RepID=UPI004056C6C4